MTRPPGPEPSATAPRSRELAAARVRARGLEARGAVRESLKDLEAELASLVAERKSWERHLALVRDEAVDRDLLEENARSVLGRTHKNDVIVMGR